MYSDIFSGQNLFSNDRRKEKIKYHTTFTDSKTKRILGRKIQQSFLKVATEKSI